MIHKDKLKEIVCRSVRYYRGESNQTLSEVSRKAHISISYLSDIEHGRTLPSLYTLMMLAEALQVNYTELVGVTIIDNNRK